MDIEELNKLISGLGIGYKDNNNELTASNPKKTSTLKYEVKKEITSVDVGKNTKAKLTIMRWGNGEFKIDLRKWDKEEDTPKKGIALTAHEFLTLYAKIKENETELINEIINLNK